jgi:hypothetical protein
MKIKRVAILVLAIALALYILVPSLSWAKDGSAGCKQQRLSLVRPKGLDRPAPKVFNIVLDDEKAVQKQCDR